MTPGTRIAVPHGILDPSCFLLMPLFSGNKANGASDGERENGRKIGMGLLESKRDVKI